MSFWTVAAIIGSAIIGSTVSATSARRQGKKSREAMQEQKYIEGAAPMLPGTGDVEIDEIANLLQGTDISALIDQMSYGEGGDEIFELLQENPQILEQIQGQMPPEVLEMMGDRTPRCKTSVTR